MATKKYVSLNSLSNFLIKLREEFANKIHTHSINDISNLQSTLNSKAEQTSLDSHASNTVSHITSSERTKWNTAYTHSQAAHSPSNAEENQNAFTHIKIGTTTISADAKTDTLTFVAGTNITLTADANGDSITITSKDTNTTYSAGTGISLSGTTFSNSGVRSVGVGSANGTISVNTNGTTIDVSVKGLGSAAYTSSSSYDAKGAADTALANAKTYTDTAVNKVKNDLLNGAGSAYDTLKELGDLIDVNVDAIDALETVAASKANASDLTSHTSNKSNPHGVSLAQLGITATASELNKMDGITATTAELNIMDGVIATTAEINYLDGVTSSIQTQLDGKAASSHTHSISNVSGLQSALDGKSSNSHTHNYAGSSSVGGVANSANILTVTDTRNVNDTPTEMTNLIGGKGVRVDFKGTSTVGLSNGTYAAVMSISPWGDTTNWSGGKNTQLGFCDDGRIQIRKGNGSGWTNWNTLIDSSTIGSQSVNYATSAGSATKATQDGNGKSISSTYETKTDASTKLAEAKTYTDTVASGKANSSHTHSISNITNLQTTLDGKSNTSHTHKYAGSSSVGGSATSAVKLDTSIAGDANTPVYFSDGKPVACTSLDLNTSGSSASCTGNSATATKLQTARTIALGTGVTGTATSFNGTGNIIIPVTDIKESYFSWGGKNLSGSVSPIDAACSNIHSANRFAFAKAAGITIEYSTNGSTYSAYSTTDATKVNLVSGIGSTYYIGARSSSTTVNDKLRITLNATNMGLYTRLRKLLINISTSYATGSNVIIEKAMKGSETTFTTVGTYQISGWSGWNSIPISAAFGGGSNQTGNIAVLRLTFGITGVNAEQTANALTIMDIIGIGDTYWSYPSTMAKTGHIYTYDSSQNTTFPANVTATTFIGALNGNASTATNIAWSGITSKPSYYDAKAIKGITRSGTTFTYTCMDGTTGTFTQQDNNTTYSVATTSANGLMSSSDKSKLDGIASGANNYTLPAAGSSLGGVKSGGDVTISNGTITVNDDSHNHVISNVDNLQITLDDKLSKSSGGTVNGNTVLRSYSSSNTNVWADSTISSYSTVDSTTGLPRAFSSIGTSYNNSSSDYGSAEVLTNNNNEIILNTSKLTNLGTMKITPTEATINVPLVSSHNSWQAIKVVHGATGKESGYTAERTDTGTCVRFGVGAAGINHGVWSHTQNRWLIHGNANNIFIGENRAYGEKELYNNTTGTGETVTLSDSAANYTYLEIYYKDNNSREYNSVKIYSPNGKTTDLFLVEAVASSTLIRRTRYTISGNKLTPDLTTAGYIQIYHNGTADKVGSETNYLRIVRVVGLL